MNSPHPVLLFGSLSLALMMSLPVHAGSVAGGNASAGGASVSGAGVSDSSIESPEVKDTDGDGLSDAEEMRRGSDLNNPDTDGDGVGDLDDGWPRHPWITAARLPDVNYAVIRLRSIGLPTDAVALEIDDNANVLAHNNTYWPLADNHFLFLKASNCSLVTVPMLGGPQSSHSFDSRVPISYMGRNGHVTGWVDVGSNPAINGAAVWVSGQTDAVSLTPISVAGRPIYFPVAVNGAGKVVGVQESIVDNSPSDPETREIRRGGVDYSASKWLGMSFIESSSSSVVGVAFIPTAIDEGSLVGVIRENAQGNMRVGILEGTAFSDLGPGEGYDFMAENYLPWNRIVGITSASPVVALALRHEDSPFNTAWWAHKQGGSWVSEDVQVWEPASQATAKITNIFSISANDRLEIIQAGFVDFSDPALSVFNLIRNGVSRPLSDYLPVGWTIEGVGPKDINNRGVILADAVSPGGQAPEPVLLVPASLRVDANGDGVIDAKDPMPSSAKSYRFWINDDIDRTHTVDESDSEEDDIGGEEASGKQPDWQSNTIQSKRDLEDFFRLQIYTAGLNDSFKNGQLFLGLKWTDVSTGAPAVKLYKHVETDGGTKYLTDEPTAVQQITGSALADVQDATRTVIEGSSVFVLPTSLFSGLTEALPKTYLLAEGCKPGKGQLKLVILKQTNGSYTEIGDGPGVWMEFKKIGDMYEHWSVGNGSGDTPAAVAGRVASETSGGPAFSYSASSPEEKKYILFVHGWNMEKWEKERFAETAYKRLWWQGYKGRFGLFSWPTTNNFGSEMDAILDSTNFDRGEFSAWRSAAPLRQLMQTLSSAYGGDLYVLSHSMGGVVASEALRLQSDAGGGQIARVYVASQAALSAHTYNGTLSTTTGSANAVQWDYNHPQIPTGTQNYGPQTPNVYKNWMAYMLGGSSVSSSSVGAIVNFYNQNDWALAAPAWQFNQITKPDYADYPSLLWEYAYQGDPESAPASDGFRKYGKYTNLTNLVVLGLGDRTTLQDRYEIMAFDAESRVKALGATANISQGITGSVDLETIWPADGQNHSTHKWHSGEFRSTIQRQKLYWKTLLSRDGFNVSTVTLP